MRLNAKLTGSAIAFLICGSAACGGGTPPPKELPGSPEGLGRPTGSAPLPADSDAGSAAPAPAPTSEKPEPPANESALAIVAKGHPAPGGISLDPTHVYFVDQGDGSVIRVPKRGGIPMMLFSAAPLTRPASLAQDGENVFFSLNQASGRTVTRVEKGTGKGSQVATARDDIKAVVLSATHVYWLAGVAIARAPKDGGPSQTVASHPSGPSAFAIDGSHLYFTTKDSVMKTGVNGGTASAFASKQTAPTSVALDDAEVFWASGDKVWKAPKKGGAPAAIGSADGPIDQIAIDSKHVYWVTQGGTLARIAKSGGDKAESLASGQGTITSMALDDDSVFLALRGTEEKKFRDGSIVKRPKN